MSKGLRAARWRADVRTYSELKLVEVSSEEWIIRTPGQFGARNWQVWIHFDDGRFTALVASCQASQ